MAREVDTKGYVKLYRKAMKDPIFKDSKAWHLFTYCLFNAYFDDKYGEAGTFTTTQIEMRKNLNWDNKTLKKFMEFLKNKGYIDYKTTPQNTFIKVLNYKKWRGY